MTKLTEKVAFDFIRYANCWEDANILLEGLAPHENAKILSIGSAGDNSFSLLMNNPAMVVAVDINKTQLFLIELKKVLIQNFDYQEVICFLGFQKSEKRIEIFNQLKEKLQPETYAYWEQNISQIESGVINEGKFERYFQKFSHYVLPLIHSKKTVEKLLAKKTEAEQISFYHQYWNTWRWRLLFKIFFSKYVMGKYGRDPEFLRQVKVNVGDFIFQKAENHLMSEQAQQNFILRYNLTGKFGNLLPHYLQPQHFEKIKQNIDKLQIVEGFAEAAILKFGKFDYMNLSNIFEYMDTDLFQKTAHSLVEGLHTEGRLAYWNLMVVRQISKILPNKILNLEDLSKQLTKKDNGFFYGSFNVDEKK